MCQVHTGAYVSLLPPGKTRYDTACHSRNTTTYILHVKMSFDEIFDLTAGVYFNFYNILHVVHITTHTHDRRKSIKQKKQDKKEDKGKEIKDKEAKSEEGK